MFNWDSVLVSLFLFICTDLTTSQAPSTLRFTSVLFRHGDRSPMNGFPGDLHNESDWPQGYGQLTQIGMNQEYALGRYIRERYTGFLNTTYQREQVYVQSTNTDRTLMSAQCVLAAVFPPQGRQQWKPDLAWQPVPVHSIDVSNDKILHYDYKACPTTKKHMDNIEKSQAFVDLTSKHRVLLDKLSNATNGAISHIYQLWPLYDGLLCEKIHKYSWPKWASDDVFSEIFSIKKRWKFWKVCTNKAVLRLTGGLLLDKMLSDMKLAARGMLNADLRAVFYSAHDTTVLALMCALKVYNDRLVPYSTSMYVELHHQRAGASGGVALEGVASRGGVNPSQSYEGWYVQVWLRNSTGPPHLLTVSGCTPNCSLSRLINVTRGNIAADWMSECGFFSFPYFTKLWHIMAITLGAGVGALILVLIISSCCRSGQCGRRRLRSRPNTYGKLRASEVLTRPEEMPMMSSAGGDSDMEG